MEIKGTEMDSIEKYLELSRTCTELFAQSEELPLVLDPKELYAFAQKSGRRIGIVYESHYHLMVVPEGAPQQRYHRQAGRNGHSGRRYRQPLWI